MAWHRGGGGWWVAFVDGLKRFWAWAATFAGIVGLYLGADAVDLVWAFWVVIGASALIVVVPKAFRRTADLTVRVRNYQTVLDRVVTQEKRIRELETAAAVGAGETAELLEAAASEGRAQIRGAALANRTAPPILESGAVADDSVLLFARAELDHRLSIGARFFMHDRSKGQVRGVVEVVGVDAAELLVTLRCVERTVPRFWETLSTRIDLEPDIPAKFALSPYKAPTADADAPELPDTEEGPGVG